MSVQEQLRILVHRHHENFIEQIASVDRLLTERDEHGRASHVNIVEAQEITHQMKGTAGSMGFAHLSTAAAELDTSLKHLKALDGPVTGDQMQEASHFLSALQKLSSETTPEMSTLYNADLSQLAK